MAGIATIICAIYIAKDASIPQSTRQDEPFVEQQDTQTIGYENGKKIFDIRIQRIKKNGSKIRRGPRALKYCK